MKSYFRFLLCLLVLAGLMMTLAPAFAQDVDLSESFSFEDGTTFSYPSAWKLDQKPTYLKISGTKTDVFMVEPSRLESYGLSDWEVLPDLLEAYFTSVFNIAMEFQSGDVEEFQIGGRDAAQYTYTDSFGVEGLLIAIRFTDDSAGIIDAVSRVGDMADDNIVLAVAGTFDRGGVVVITDCIVSTTTGGTVAIRVGPGTNRTSYAFLPANQDFVVQGQAEADDGSIWWKLDKEQAAPGKSAAEAWIAREDVDFSGGCDSVVDASAPPIIPIVSAPPAAVGGGGGVAAPPAGTEIQPQSGSWTITFSPTIPMSCLDVPTQNATLQFPSERATLTIISSTSLRFGGDIYTRTQPNTYIGLFNFDDGDSVRLTLRVASPTLMSGEFTINFVQQGHQCSGTVYSTITHN